MRIRGAGGRVATTRIRRIAIAGLVTLLHATGARADERAQLDDRTLAAGCASCHGPGGRSSSDAAFSPLAGMAPAQFRDALQGFKHGTREGTLMPQLAKGLSDAQIERLAAYFAAQDASARQR